MSNPELQNTILQAIQQLNRMQQLRLLEFIKTLPNQKVESSSNRLLQFAGYFDKESISEMKASLQDLEDIDPNEW